jgi:Fic family protein
MTVAVGSRRYEPQIGGYKAFVPNRLPSGGELQLSPNVTASLSRADRALARLDGSIDNLPDPDLFVFSYIRKEAVLSSQIEGTQASLSDVLKAEAKILDPYAPADVFEVINHIESLRHGLSEIERRSVSTNLICEMHAILMRGGRGAERRPGEIRRTQNWIGAEGSSVGDAIFIPPPPDRVRDCLADLERFINEDQQLPLLIKVGLAHAQFETIHPFLDGNGRLGRMLITLMLGHAGALSKPVLYISHYFRRYRSSYANRLQATRDEGDWDGWLEFFLKAVVEVAEDATRLSRAIIQLREVHRQLIIESTPRGAGNSLKLLEHLFRFPIVTVGGTQGYLELTYAAANKIIARFVDLGILVEITGGARDRAFRYETYYRLFESSP